MSTRSFFLRMAKIHLINRPTNSSVYKITTQFKPVI